MNKTPLDLNNQMPKTRIILSDPKSLVQKIVPLSANRMSLQVQ